MKCNIYFHLKTFWRCFCFRSGLVALFLKISECCDSWCTDSSFSSLLVKLFQVFESALLDSILKLGPPCCLWTFSYPISSFQSTLYLICFDTALLEQPPLSVMTLCDLLSLWRVSMIVFWTIAKSAVFPIIVLSKNKRYPEFIYIYIFYIYAFSRRFYPKRLTIAFRLYNFISMCVPGNRTHILLRCWRNALPLSHTRTRMDGYLLKLKCKYSNILRYWIFDFY